jgi:ketosteroid isomerase-like protein
MISAAQETSGQRAQNAVDIVQAALDAMKAGDSAGWQSLVAPDCRIIEPSYLSYGGTYVGCEGFRETIRHVHKALDTRTLETVSRTGDSDRAVFLLTARLKASGEQRWLSEHWVVEDGLIREVRVFWSDPAE